MKKHPMHEAHRLRQLRGDAPPIHDNQWVRYMQEEIQISNAGIEEAQERLRAARAKQAEAEQNRYLRQAEYQLRSAARWEAFAKFSLFVMAIPVLFLLAVTAYWTVKMFE